MSSAGAFPRRVGEFLIGSLPLEDHMSQYHPQLSILWHDSRLGYDSRIGGHCLEDALKGTIDNLGVEVVTKYQRTLFEGT